MADSCTVQQCSVDWKASPQIHSQLFLSAVCKDLQSVCSRWNGNICIDGLVPLEQTVGEAGGGGPNALSHHVRVCLSDHTRLSFNVFS